MKRHHAPGGVGRRTLACAIGLAFAGGACAQFSDLQIPTPGTSRIMSAEGAGPPTAVARSQDLPRDEVLVNYNNSVGSSDIDPTDGGQTSRYSLSFNAEWQYDDGALKIDVYAIWSRLDLSSNFTFFVDDPVDLDPAAFDGDPFEQAERRTVLGAAVRRNWNTSLAGHQATNTLGVELRHDRLDPIGVYANVARGRVAVTQESVVRQTSLGIYGENSTQWTPWLRSIVGLHGDTYTFDVNGSIPQNSGKTSASIASPKLSLVFGPWNKTEFFANYGYGFHSNDARGTTATVKAKDPTEHAERVGPLVRSKGGELGVRTELVPGLQSSLVLWQRRLGSELVFVGDAGETQPTRASKRYGIEWNNHYIARPWLLFDAGVSLSHARFTDEDSAGNHIPGAIATVVSLGSTLTGYGPWFGQFQLRYFGPRPLIEDNSQRSKATTLAYLRAGYKVNKNVRLAVDVFNLFDTKASDSDHYDTVEPRSFRLTVSATF